MEAILIHPNNQEQLAAVKAFAKALKMNFETKNIESPYDSKFVAKINKSRKEIEKGNSITVDPNKPIWESIL